MLIRDYMSAAISCMCDPISSLVGPLPRYQKYLVTNQTALYAAEKQQIIKRHDPPTLFKYEDLEVLQLENSLVTQPT